MPELPDIVVLAESMKDVLKCKTILATTVHQPKVLNKGVATFCKALRSRTFQDFHQRGKWIKDWIRTQKLLKKPHYRVNFGIRVALGDILPSGCNLGWLITLPTT